MLAKIKSDFWFEFLSSPATVVSALVIAVMVLSCVFAPGIAPHTPFDPATISILVSKLKALLLRYVHSVVLLGNVYTDAGSISCGMTSYRSIYLPSGRTIESSLVKHKPTNIYHIDYPQHTVHAKPG